MTNEVHHNELTLLHEICDGDIALHGVELAIQVCCDLTYQSRAEVLRLPREIILDESQPPTLLPLEIHVQAIGLIIRFENLGNISDLEKATAMLRKAIISTPLSSPDRPLMLTSLGNSYQCRYERFGDLKDIDSAIRQHSNALISIPCDSTHRPAIITNFGNAYLCRFEQFAERKDFDFAIDQMLEAVRVTTGPLVSAERAKLLYNIGKLYQRRFEEFGDIKDLNSAIEQHLEAVSIPFYNPDPLFHYSLGNLYQCRFERFGTTKDVDSAIEQLLKASASVSLNNSLYPGIMTNLGNSYLSRFDWFGNTQDLESAIKHQLEAVAFIPINGPNRLRILNNLALSYQCRFERFGKKEDIDSAIRHQLELVVSAPLDNPERAIYIGNLGSSYQGRYTHFGEVKDLDSAINEHLEALASAPPNSPQDPFLHNLGCSYQSRFEHSGHVKDIDSAIERHLEAVAFIPLDSSLRSDYLTSLGNSYRIRFIRFGEMKDIDLAIKRQLEAVTSTPLESAKQAVLFNNLGHSHLIRFNRCGEMKDIDLSIKLLLTAVSSIPLDSPLHPKLVDNLGNSYADRFKRSGDVKDIDLAIKEMLKAVASASPDTRPRHISNLGIFHLYRFQFLREVRDIDLAIKILVQVVDIIPLDSPDRPKFLNHLGDSYLLRDREPNDLEESISNFRLSSRSPNGLPSLRIRGSLEWARLAHKHDTLESASEAYDQAIHLLPQVAWIGLNAVAQLKELSSDIQMLGCNAAACMIALAQAASERHDTQRHLGRAIELLDQSRSILWSQTSNFKRDLEDLQEVDSDLANNLDNVGKFLAQGCFRDPKDPLSETDAQLYRRYAEKWEELVHRIRGLPNFHHFLLPSPISTLRTAAAEGPVVIVNSSEYRCDAVIVRSQGDLVLVPLLHITAEELKSLANQQEELASRKSKSMWIPSKDYSMSSETLEQVLNRTWLLVGEPIAQKFEELGLLRGSDGYSKKSRVWWCLTGSLSFLPIHASFPSTKPGIGMMDIVVSSYTPTISTLLRAQQQNKLKRPTFRMLAVGQSSIAGMTPLPGVTEEIAFIQKILGVEALILDECKATVDEVAASLLTCSWAHFACHGVQDRDKPMDSGLVMWDRHRLTLSRLAQSSLALASAEFAFLSSCESAKGSKQFPNEAMHLAAGLQFIGYLGVIGTMWSVGDKDALSVAMHIYGELFKNGTSRASSTKAALALNQAVLLLRSNNVPLARWVPFVHFGL